jgi:hypothetical protein
LIRFDLRSRGDHFSLHPDISGLRFLEMVSDILACLTEDKYTCPMQSIIVAFFLLLAITFPQNIYAKDCGALPTKDKLLLKASDIHDSVMLFLLMDPKQQMKYRLNRANRLYQEAQKTPVENLSYTYAVRAEDHMTRFVALLRWLSTTKDVEIDAIEQSILEHAQIVDSMKSDCDWPTIGKFIQSNQKTIRQLHYLRLPTDTQMKLL